MKLKFRFNFNFIVLSNNMFHFYMRKGFNDLLMRLALSSLGKLSKFNTEQDRAANVMLKSVYQAALEIQSLTDLPRLQ